MRNRFDNQLAEMNNELISMGALCENAIASAVKALLEGDIKRRRRHPHRSGDRPQRTRNRVHVSQAAAAAAAGGKRSASDLFRAEMITDIERIGDQASDIAEM